MENKYFLALIPPSPLYEEIHHFKEEAYRHFNTKAALRSPPHLTLCMPFALKAAKEDLLVDALTNFGGTSPPFDVELDGFGHFDHRVIFINVIPSVALQHLFGNLNGLMKRSFNIFNADYKNRGFNPHITVAFRDLKKQHFHEAWEFYRHQSYRRTFKASAIALLRHDGQQWCDWRRFDV